MLQTIAYQQGEDLRFAAQGVAKAYASQNAIVPFFSVSTSSFGDFLSHRHQLVSPLG